MIEIIKTVLPSPEQWEIIIEGMRNPMNSWGNMDSGICPCGSAFNDCLSDAATCPRKSDDFDDAIFCIGPNDNGLMMQLAKGGPVHGKYRRMIPIFLTINAPLYWWKEFDTYKVGTVANSCSTMHKIHAKPFTLDDFSVDHLLNIGCDLFNIQWENGLFNRNVQPMEFMHDWIIDALNIFRTKYLETKDKDYWWQMIQMLPSSYNQKRTVMLNYEVLHNIYHSRKNHKLDEWHTFCDWIEQLPYSEIITIGG